MSQLKEGIKYNIIKGPGKNDWIQHFHNFFQRQNEKLYITIDMSEEKLSSSRRFKIELLVQTLLHQDGSCERYFFKGYVTYKDSRHYQYVKGYYDLREPSGWIKIISEVKE